MEELGRRAGEEVGRRVADELDRRMAESDSRMAESDRRMAEFLTRISEFNMRMRMDINEMPVVNEMLAEAAAGAGAAAAPPLPRALAAAQLAVRNLAAAQVAVRSSGRKRPSSEADLEDAPGREERLRLLRLNEDARKHYERQRDQAQKERDQAQKERDEALQERDDAEKQCSEAQALCAKIQHEIKQERDKLWKHLSEAHKEREEVQKSLWHMRGSNLYDLPDAQLESLLEDIMVAKERVEKMQLRRTAEARVLAKHPDYACPISLALMRDPVVTDDGQSYERKEIEAWFKTQREANEPLTSPLRAPLKSAQLVANHSLRRAIEAAVVEAAVVEAAAIV